MILNRVQIENTSLDEVVSIIKREMADMLSKSLKAQERPEQEELLTVDEAMAFLKCSKQTLWNWRNNGILHSHRIGNRVYYKKSEIMSQLIKQGV